MKKPEWYAHVNELLGKVGWHCDGLMRGLFKPKDKAEALEAIAETQKHLTELKEVIEKKYP